MTRPTPVSGSHSVEHVTPEPVLAVLQTGEQEMVCTWQEVVDLQQVLLVLTGGAAPRSAPTELSPVNAPGWASSPAGTDSRGWGVASYFPTITKGTTHTHTHTHADQCSA